MAFCHPLPLNISNNCSNPESAVCQANKVISADESWSMGAYDNITIFHESMYTHKYIIVTLSTYIHILCACIILM